MGGGGSSQPYDLLGGQFASATLNGSPVATSPGWAPNYSAIGKGFEAAGAGVASGGGGTAQVSPSELPYDQQQQSPMGAVIIPHTELPPQTQAMLDALMRIGMMGPSGGGAPDEPLIPDTGAAKYWYVDPRAQQKISF